MRHKQKRNNNNSNKQNYSNNTNSGSSKNKLCLGEIGPRPKGLTNLGNTCYLNSILQVLMNAPSFGELLATDSKLAELQGCDGIIVALINLYKNYRLTGTQAALTPSNIIKHIRQKSGRFHRFEQEDSHELLRSLLDFVRTDELKRKKIPSVIDSLFGGYFLSSVKCNKCNHLSQHLEPFFDISLAISGTDTLLEALKRFSASEILDGPNKINCDKCKNYEVGSKSTRIAIPPSILTLHFKRFEVSGNPSSKQRSRGGASLSKISKDVAFSEFLNLSKYTSDLYYDPSQEAQSSLDNDKENMSANKSDLPLFVSKRSIWYSLFGVVCHSGGLKGGHYTAFVKYNNSGPLNMSHSGARDQLQFKDLNLDKIFKAIRDYNLGRGYFDYDDVDYSDDEGDQDQTTRDNGTIGSDEEDEDSIETSCSRKAARKARRKKGRKNAKPTTNGKLPASETSVKTSNSAQFKSDDWYYISDTSVSRSNLSSVLKSQAYILFYERVSKRPEKSSQSPDHGLTSLDSAASLDLSTSQENPTPPETPTPQASPILPSTPPVEELPSPEAAPASPEPEPVIPPVDN